MKSSYFVRSSVSTVVMHFNPYPATSSTCCMLNTDIVAPNQSVCTYVPSDLTATVSLSVKWGFIHFSVDSVALGSD